MELKNIVAFLCIMEIALATSCANPITDCGCNLDTPYTAYTMNANKTSTSTCFTVTAANVSLNCHGYSITGDDSAGHHGVYSNKLNTTIKNCIIGNFVHGIFFDTASNGTIWNTTATSSDASGFGLYLYNAADYNAIVNSTFNSSESLGLILVNSQYNNITNVSAWSGNSIGIYVSSSDYNKFNNTIGTSTNSYAVALEHSYYNNFSNSTFVANTFATIHLFASGANTFYWNKINNTGASNFVGLSSYEENYYNTTIGSKGEGNLWADVMNGSVVITGTDHSVGFPSMYIGTEGSGYPYSEAKGGRVESPYVVDYAPLTNNGLAILTCGTNLDASGTTYTMGVNSSILGTNCFNITAANVTLDCNGSSITGNNASGTYGVYSNQTNTTIKNCIIGNFSTSIYMNNTAYAILYNDTLNNTFTGGYGILLNNANTSNITNITSGTTGGYSYGLYLNASHFNNLTNVVSRTSGTYGYGILLNASNNSNLNNVVVNTTGTFAYGINFISSNNNLLRNANASITSGNDAYGLYFHFGNNNTIQNITSTSNGNNAYGVYLLSGSNNTIANATFNTSGSAAYGVLLQNGTGNTLFNNTISNSGDISYGAYIFNSYGGRVNITRINASSSEAGAYGIYMENATNYSIANSTISTAGDFSYGIYLTKSNGSNITMVTSTSMLGDSTNNILISESSNNRLVGAVSVAYGADSYGIVLTSANNNIVANSSFTSDLSNPALLLTAINNTFANNTLTSGDGTQDLLYINAASHDNYFYWNNFTSTNGHYVQDLNGLNFYNTTEGNVYANVISGGIGIEGVTNSTGYPILYVGTSGLGYPYNNITSLGKFFCNFAGCGDYAPLTNQYSLPSSMWVSLLPNITNASTIVSAIATGDVPGTVFLYQFRNWTDVLQAYSTNNNYSVPAIFTASRVFVDAIATNYITNSSAVSNYSLVQTNEMGTYGSNFVATQVFNFYTVYGAFIIGIFGLGVAYIFGGSLGNTALIAAILYFVGWLIGGFGILLYGAIALLVLGFLLRYGGL